MYVRKITFQMYSKSLEVQGCWYQLSEPQCVLNTRGFLDICSYYCWIIIMCLIKGILTNICFVLMNQRSSSSAKHETIGNLIDKLRTRCLSDIYPHTRYVYSIDSYSIKRWVLHLVLTLSTIYGVGRAS